MGSQGGVGVVPVTGLNEHPPGRSARPARPATCMSWEKSRRRPPVGGEQGGIGPTAPYQGQPREVVPWPHLGADQDVGAAPVDAFQHCLPLAAGLDRVAVHPPGRGPRRNAVPAIPPGAGSRARGLDVLIAAGGTGPWDAGSNPQWWQRKRRSA